MSVRRRILYWTLAVLAVLAVAAAATLYYIARQSPMLRDRVVAALNERFKSQVALESLQVSAWPKPGVNGTGLELRHNGRTDVDPLITIKRFSGDSGLTGLFDTPLHLGTVRLEGMTIKVPPGGMSAVGRSFSSTSLPGNRRAPSLVIDVIHATPVWLEVASRNPAKLPRVFDIHELEMSGFRPDAPATFHARLTNAIPTGELHTDGSFGPYVASDPQKTDISGRYTLEQAQLNDIKGLGGTLASTGTYKGQLERLVVEGETRSKDFTIDVAQQPVALTTTFRAVVDGTNGDTILDQVHATLIRTPIEAHGKVVRAREVKGRHVELDVDIAQGHIDDVLMLAMKSGKPPLSGGLALKARLVIPAGEGTVLDRMQLNGNFSLSRARFANFNLQKRLNVLSKRAQGDEEADGAESVVSNMSGKFVMRDGKVNFSALTFSVPGARVELTGSYAIKAEAMNFQGNLLLDASLADTTSGLKAVAARLVQPFFRRPGGGSKLPIRINGTRSQPSFGLDLKKAFLPG